jgi:hypothetical protein
MVLFCMPIWMCRDSFGAPDILIRKDKNFYTPFAGVPSASDDDLAPGAG